ncbi:7300_t:CDS:10, partial [Acaulospora morrowiae]
VDDQSDTKLLQENTVAALIEVNKALTPLSKEPSRSSIDSFLNCLSEVSKKHSSLATKIGSCSSHNLALQNMYRNIANRGEVTKERIKNAATIGLYTFHHVEQTNLCEVVLTYDTTQNHDDTNSTPRVTASYNLADLHDLYGRALLIGKSRASTDRSSGENDVQDIHKDINMFIMQVDLVQQIIDVASKLIQLGHFLYQKMKVEARGVSELQDVLDKLAQDLKTWEDIVIRAQNEHYYLTFFSARHILAFYNYFRTDNLEQDDKLKEVCQNLIRFVNDAAQLPDKTGKWDAVQDEDNFFSVLCEIGATLFDIFSDIPQRTRSIHALKPVVADTVLSGKIFVAACHSRSLVPNVILSLFANHQSLPEPWQILICRSTTTAEEISLFIKRSFIAADNEYKDHLFCIANVEFLDFELQYNLVQTIRDFQEKKKEYFLALVCTQEKGRNHHILDQFAENMHVTNGLDTESMELLYKEICPNVECVISKMSGQGKTEWIRESSFRGEKVPRTLLISDGAYFGTLVRQLADCNLSAVESLHLDVTLITHPYEVNFFLFELLTFKVVSDGFDIVHLPETLIFIEIASTIKHYLLDSLPITKYLRRQDLQWNMDNLKVSRHVNSPVQIVSRYLDLYSRGIIDETNIRFTGDSAIDEALPAERCRQLLQQYFFDGPKDDIHSYRFLEIFMNVLADQLVRFSASSFFQIEQLRSMTQETNIRSSLLDILITCSKEFATRAINTKNKQEENARAIKEEDAQDMDNARLGDITQWDDSNHLMVVFLSQMPDSICALYREKNKVPNNVKNLLKSQNAELQDYDSMEPSLLLERLEQLARQKMHKLDGLPKYALSIENLLKMAMILLRSRANMPVVCCGEAGCGKVRMNKTSKNRKSKYDTKTRSLVLALGVCYLFRLHDQLQRKNYRMKMIEIIKNHQPNFKTSPNTRNDAFEIIIRNEQDEYINHMKNYPDGTAWNEALLENILVMIVCIQTRIPVFIIGAPGSSKSLAVRIISMNLRGIDSKDPYFRTLPQVYMIPHQGSSSSTSEGIEKVFQSAQNYQETSSKENPVTSVVLLDEVGLAETSPHNPLKVLHALLEPPLGSKDDVPAVSVIGISNWRLDNSKSSRALLVQRPLFAENDLIDTAKRLLDGTKRFDNINLFLKKLADSYLRYIKNQRFANFHGLRDYYFLIKSIRSMGKKDRKPNVQLALARNFGGADNMEELCTIYFQNVLKPAHVSKFNYTPIPVQELINANLAEKDARNLMLIGNGNSIVTFQTYQLRQQNIEPVVIIGSQFPDDKDGGEYSYATLNRIMMCVETGRCLILTDLEVIYGSLYDLFNQNFITDENSGDKGDSGDENSQRNYTRISLGPYSNPMLYVHPNFRCILVLDEAKLPLADPPLLNRFEKQKLTLEETLTERQAMIFNRLKEWTSQISSIYESGDEDAKSHFKEKDMFIGFTSEETLQSLIIDRCGKNADSDDDTIVLLCKESLISIATSDGIVRADKSLLKAIDASEVQKWQDVYFQNQQHGGIQEFYRAQPKDNLISHLTIINTFSNINTDIKLLLKGIMSCQVDKLSTFKSEAELQNQIKRFYESEHDLYILQCDLSTVNAGCIRLAKFIIEQYQNESVNKEYQQIKNVCIILHFSRNFDKDSANLFNFMCGWNQMTIENLTTSENSLSLFLHSTISEILNEQLLFEKILSQELLWCLLCMKHPSSKKSVDHIRELIRDIPKSARLVECLKLRTEEWLQANSSDQWHLDVALDQKSLTLHSSFSVALETHVRALIRKPIAKLLYILERNHSITLLFSWDNNADESDENELFKFWKEIFINKKIVNIDDMVMDPRPDLYSTSGNYLNLKFPFSYYFMEQIDQYKKLYFEELDLIYENPENLGEDGNLRPEVKDEFLEKFSEGIRTTLTALTPAILELARSLYVEDFITVSSTNAGYSKESDIKLLYILFSRSCDADALNDLVKLHIFWWTNSDALISELELVRMCSPNILEENNNIGDNDLFGSHLIDQVGKMMLEKIIELGSETANDNMNNNIQEWQRQVVNILSFCANIETSSESKILQFLRICNDLVSSEVIKISDIVNAINLLREPDPDSFLSQEFVDRILELFIEIPTTTERMMTSHCSFFRRCLDIISPNSPVRFHLYEILFGQEPHPLFGSVLSRVLLKDIEAESENIPLIIQNATAILRRSAHLNAINNTLKDYQLDSPIFALCCDVMQSDFFAFYSLKELVNSFQDAINILCSTNIEPLQLILAVSSLKELVSVLWKSVSIHDATREPLEFDVEEVDIDDLIENINGIMERQSFLIRSLKLYFLRDLYAKGLSLHEIKCFSKVQCRTFPWLNDLEWSDEDNRIGFVPYRFYTQYKEAEEAFAPLYARGQQTKAMDFLNKVLTDSSVHQKMSLMGTIISHLYGICALRERGPHEDTAVQFLRTQLPNMPFDNFYRETLLSFTTNTHLLYSISPETSQTELLIRSVIVHIIALHSCLSAAESPLAAYLQTLKACKNTYILTSCADADANILLEIGDALGHFTRYECECGFKYIVTECGGTQEQGICPRCKSPIGGINYNVNPGNTRIDAQAIRGNEEANAPLGYVYESIESRKDVNYRIRNMTSVSYRVLHLFVHALIAATSQEDRWDFFNNQQNQEINQEPLEYCKQHINNDWNMLTNLFNCNDETLALVLHSILTSMAENQITTIVRLNTIENRRLWEHEFTHRYITPKVNNAHGTATEFQRLVKNVQHKLESEINETLDVDDEYQNKFYPRIWRRVAETSLENLRAYCVGYQNFSTEFPLLSLFFEYEDQLPLSKNLAPIVKFARILSSKLSYRLKRKDAHTFTFAQFLSNESRPIENLKEAFENFAGAWNSVRSHITRYGCREFPTPMPEMSENLPVVYALIEMRDESLYICGAIEHLVNLQNTFLQQVLTIKPGCPSLRFLEQEQFSNNKGKNRASPSQYYIKSLSLSEARDKNIINYEWDPQLLSYSQRDLRLGHGQEIRYELCKIEAELAYSLIFDKVHLNKSNELFWLDIFSYHLELFSNSRTILSEIRELVPQETISADKPRIFENPTELLSELEVLLCFLKRTSGGDREMEITDYLNKWMKLSALTGNDQFSRMVNGLRLKHVISLYELVEEKVADVEIEFIDEKYKAKLSKQLQEEIMAGVDFEQSHGFGGSSVRKYKISHAAFTTVLKRFMFRYLSSEMYSEKEKLADYLAGETMIDCWQAWVSEEVIRENFPKSLLIANTYDAYKYTMKQIQNMNKANKSSSSSKPNESTTRARHGTSKDNGRSGRGGGRGGRGGRGGVRGGRAKE